MSDEKSDEKIIDFSKVPLTITRNQERYDYCQTNCRNIELDDHFRTCKCRECGKVIDSFDYLLNWANEGDRKMIRLRHLDDEIRLKTNELETIRTALAREKARVRKINPDAPEVWTWRREQQVREANHKRALSLRANKTQFEPA